MRDRLDTFDALKGFLIIVVIVGHVSLGALSENPLRMIIYFFHMPLFLAVSGYFIKDSLLDKSVKGIYLKYKNRIILPFLIAFVFYTMVVLVKKYFAQGVEPVDLVKMFLYPYYHLWYIPAILFFILYTKVIRSFKTPWKVVTISIFVLLAVFFEANGQDISDNFIYRAFGDKRFYYFFIYFYFGYTVSKYGPKVTKGTAVIFFALGLLMYSMQDYWAIAGLGKMIANLSLIFLVINTIEKINFSCLFLASIGRVSLPIYLWHVFLILLIKFLPVSNLSYYIICAVFLSVFILFVTKLIGKSIFMDKYIFGRFAAAS